MRRLRMLLLDLRMRDALVLITVVVDGEGTAASILIRGVRDLLLVMGMDLLGGIEGMEC